MDKTKQSNENESLIEKLLNPDSAIRVDAALELGKLQEKSAIEPLIKTLDDENPSVRFQASKSLAEIGKPAVKSLVNALKGEEGNIKRYATFALKNMGDDTVVEHLIVALKDKDWSVRKTSAKSLGEMGSNKAVDPLIMALDDDDWGVKCSVAKALGDIGDIKAIYPLKKARRAAKGDKEFKKVATKSLKRIG
ncbi:MAG: HEAT repeat domain-containing protein [Methanobacterium sp.]|nr:HEAT repeat domain-containing protein [Methanobacterium sp.]